MSRNLICFEFEKSRLINRISNKPEITYIGLGWCFGGDTHNCSSMSSMSAVLCGQCRGSGDKLPEVIPEKLPEVIHEKRIEVLTRGNELLPSRIAKLEKLKAKQMASRRFKDRSRVSKEEMKTTNDGLKACKARLRAGKCEIARLNRAAADRPVSVPCLNCKNSVWPCRIAQKWTRGCFVTAVDLPKLVTIRDQIFYKEVCNDAEVKYHLVFNVCHGGKEYTGNFNGNDLKKQDEIVRYFAEAEGAEAERRKYYKNEVVIVSNDGNKEKAW